MKQRKLAIFLLFLMSIYAIPVMSMHVCIGQSHHHGNCDGNMGNGEKEGQESAPYQYEKAEHIHCFQLQKEINPCIHCKTDVTVQQLAIIAVAFDLHSGKQEQDFTPEYRPPPNKEPPPVAYRIRPPPSFWV